MGTLCTVLVLAIVIFYAVLKAIQLFEKDLSRIQRTLEEDYFDQEKFVTNRNGDFNVAFALASSDTPNEVIDSFESYGRLRLIYHTKFDSTFIDSSKDISTTACSRDTISEGNDYTRSFYPPKLENGSTTTKSFIENTFTKMKCFSTQVNLTGDNSNSSKESYMRIIFE